MITLKEIKENLGRLEGTIVEKNGKYMYIKKGDKRTGMKAEINKDTEGITSPFELLAYILENKCAI